MKSLLQTQKTSPLFKVWLGKNSLSIIGEGRAELLKAIQKYGSIREAVKHLGWSYKYAWSQIIKIENAIKKPILKRKRGGKKGGGAELTETAVELLKEYERVKKYISNLIKDKEFWESVELKITARNRLKGVIKTIEKNEVTSTIKIEVSTPAIITAVITKEAAEELKLKPGDKVKAVIKATEVMIAK